MKSSKWLVAGTFAFGSFAASAALADVRVTDSFAYSNGNLVGQGSWNQTSTSATNPIQVVSGQASLANTGQDAWKAYVSSVSNTGGTSLFTAFDFSIATAQATGDYFLHVSDPAGTTTNFYQRVFARSSGSGFQLGLLDASGTGSTTTWGTGVLSFNTSYRAVVSWDFNSGLDNDSFQVYIDPTSSVEGNNATYLTHAWTSTSVDEPAQVAAVNLRQGATGAFPTLTVDDLIVATTFAEAAAIPEPASFGLLALGGLALLRRRRA